MPDNTAPKDFGEAELKHLEFLQNVVARQASNSFLLKGWSVTLVAAIIGLTANNPGTYSVLITVFPALVFWTLDAFYLGQERQFREMHKDALIGKLDVLSMDPSDYEEGVPGLLKSAVSRSVLWFHLAVVVVVIVAAMLQ